MRTSVSQFQLLVEFMERNGDLSKPTEGPQGRMNNIQRWAQLTEMLNADSTGDTKSAEKWRKEDIQPVSASIQVHSEVSEATENTFGMWCQARISTSAQTAQPEDEIELPPPIRSVVDTPPIPEAPQVPTPLPATPRRRRRLLQTTHSPMRRRTRTHTQSELARQAFVNSDNEWRMFQQKCEEERLRLREKELHQQERWLDLFGQFIVLGNRIVDTYISK